MPGLKEGPLMHSNDLYLASRAYGPMAHSANSTWAMAKMTYMYPIDYAN